MAATFRTGKFLDRLYSAFRIAPRNASRLDLSGCFSRVCIYCVSQKNATKCAAYCASSVQPFLRLRKTPGHTFSKARLA
ncbi:hypothetical protein C1881_07095 [Slackia isoflavoniconvertens]|uniref:Uncharacterized protein n=1 Tax=Slackia isoflavoniconvertens TaxID=572010 RepID=A0A369LDN1_9ACTN|nr:hypothetical protein C1881_07095 [Slackia isoflavoniconvertens]